MKFSDEMVFRRILETKSDTDVDALAAKGDRWAKLEQWARNETMSLEARYSRGGREYKGASGHMEYTSGGTSKPTAQTKAEAPTEPATPIEKAQSMVARANYHLRKIAEERKADPRPARSSDLAAAVAWGQREAERQTREDHWHQYTL